MDENLIRTLTETEARSKSNQHRLDTLEGKMDVVATTADIDTAIGSAILASY